MLVLTISHSTRSIEEFIDLLRAHGARALIDVRRYPGSRRFPQFAKDTLAASLEHAGIEYVHEPDLGGRRSPRKNSPNTAWRNEQFRGYADHLATPMFEAALTRVLERKGPVALMCAEAVPWRCHRQLISDVLTLRGHEVRHILSTSRASLHHPNENAHMGEDGVITYPASMAAPTREQLDLGFEKPGRSARD
jgi:uncharacterized protein (DUF488 family)